MVTADMIFEPNFLEGKESMEACVMFTENH